MNSLNQISSVCYCFLSEQLDSFEKVSGRFRSSFWFFSSCTFAACRIGICDIVKLNIKYIKYFIIQIVLNYFKNFSLEILLSEKKIWFISCIFEWMGLTGIVVVDKNSTVGSAQNEEGQNWLPLLSRPYVLESFGWRNRLVSFEIGIQFRCREIPSRYCFQVERAKAKKQFICHKERC